MTNKEDSHGHECAGTDLNHEEGGRDVYECILILAVLHSGTGNQYLTRKHGIESEQYQYDARYCKHSAEGRNFQTKKYDARQCAGLQVQCAAIDSINREKVQHVVCSSKRPGVNRVIASLHKHTSERECDFSRGCKPFQK